MPCFHGCLPNHHHVATQAGVQSGHARLRRVPFHRGFCAVIDYKLRLQARVVGSFARQVTRSAPTHLPTSECSRMPISRAGGEGGQGRPTVPTTVLPRHHSLSSQGHHFPPRDGTLLCFCPFVFQLKCPQYRLHCVLLQGCITGGGKWQNKSYDCTNYWSPLDLNSHHQPTRSMPLTTTASPLPVE